ncbi:glycosyltransferase [Lactobacillus amylovorus subsp. animalium]|uniref:Glycosyltransferase n=1 Tax=Lactobacillus amylovorus subsp. animalium TaxID=3378536 RepID=A0ABD0C1K1_LACAM|nr:glycosyltransferase [Lactobacillus amylovorus]GMM15029.1 glycosyltransferase [Lactobacillus amylovorus]
MGSKKLLVVGDFISGSGLTRFIFNTFPYFDKNKFNIQCVGYGVDPNQETDKQCKKLGWRLDRVVPVNENPINHIMWWKRYFKRNKFDIIYFNYSSSWNYCPLKLAKKYTNAKIVCHSHNSYYSHVFNNSILMAILNRINNRGKNFFNNIADLKIATSKESALWMFNTLEDVRIINNGIKLNDFKFDKYAREELRKQLNIPLNDKLIGFAGVLQKRKNPLFALQVFAEYSKNNPNSMFLIIGEGPLKDNIVKRVHNLGIEKKVKFISYTNKLNKWYSAMDVLLFPSLYEGFGLVPLEAQVSNLMVLASNNVAPQVFVTKNIKKIEGFNKKDWTQKLELKTDSTRLKMNPLLNEFDVKRQAVLISNLIENN